MTLNNLAVFYKTAKQYEKADAYYQGALSVFERGLGPEHPKVAVTLENYANLLRKLGRTEDARAIADWAKKPGDSDRGRRSNGRVIFHRLFPYRCPEAPY